MKNLPISSVVVGGNPDKYHANLATKRFMNKHNIQKPDKCEVCSKTGKVDTHHPDYKFPEKFVFICRSCHAKIHCGTLVLLKYRKAKVYPVGYWKTFWNHPDNLPTYAKALLKYLGRLPDWFWRDHPELAYEIEEQIPQQK